MNDSCIDPQSSIQKVLLIKTFTLLVFVCMENVVENEACFVPNKLHDSFTSHEEHHSHFSFPRVDDECPVICSITLVRIQPLKQHFIESPSLFTFQCFIQTMCCF